jgi:hypothetical protein
MIQRPLWQQLAGVWLGAVLLSALLLRLDLRRPYKFFWLIPYPSWRTITPMVVQFFRVRPVSATAVIGIPVAALIVSLALVGGAIARSRAPGGAAGLSVSREQSNDR